jgi:hypothetical protein
MRPQTEKSTEGPCSVVVAGKRCASCGVRMRIDFPSSPRRRGCGNRSAGPSTHSEPRQWNRKRSENSTEVTGRIQLPRRSRLPLPIADVIKVSVAGCDCRPAFLPDGLPASQIFGPSPTPFPKSPVQTAAGPGVKKEFRSSGVDGQKQARTRHNPHDRKDAQESYATSHRHDSNWGYDASRFTHPIFSKFLNLTKASSGRCR